MVILFRDMWIVQPNVWRWRMPYYETDWNCGAAVVMGSEGQGVSRLVREKSDFIVSIPMYGKVNSLNVSTAASVILCHAARMQRL